MQLIPLLLLATLAACLPIAAETKPVRVVSPAAEASARLLAQVEPRIKAIYETNAFAMRSFGA